MLVNASHASSNWAQIAKWSTALSVKHHTKIQIFFSFSGEVIDRKVLL